MKSIIMIFKRFFFLILLGSVILVTSLLTSQIKTPTRSLRPTFIIKVADKCLGVEVRSKENGSAIIQQACKDDLAQVFEMVFISSKRIFLKNVHSGKCMDMSGTPIPANQIGAQLKQWDCNGTTPTQFDMINILKNTLSLKNVHSNFCLEAKQGSDTEGTTIHQKNCSSVGGQVFTLEGKPLPVVSPSGPSLFEFVTLEGLCLDISSNPIHASQNGARLSLWDCNKTTPEMFRPVFLSTTRVHLKNEYSGKCVDVSNTPILASKIGAIIHQWDCNGTTPTQFDIMDAGEGYVSFKNVYSQKCIEIQGARTKGAIIQQNDCNTSFASQRFLVRPTAPTPRPYITLQTANGKYLKAELGGGILGTVWATANKPDAWEYFEMIGLGGDKVALKSYSGTYLSAEGGGGLGLSANRTTVSTWETFHLEQLGGGKVAFRTPSGYYVVAEGGGGGLVMVNRRSRSAWETFTLQTHERRPEATAPCQQIVECKRQYADLAGGGTDSMVVHTFDAKTCYRFPTGCSPWYCDGNTVNWRDKCNTVSACTDFVPFFIGECMAVGK
jgi:hypothetical protein